MGTTQITAALFHVQELDLEMDRLKAEQQTITASLQGDTRLRHIRKELQAAQQQLQVSLQAQEEAEWTLEDLAKRLQLQEQRLYNGTITSPKELQSLQFEVQRLRAQYNRQEEHVLVVIDTVDEQKQAVKQKESMQKEAEGLWQTEFVALTERREQLEQRQQDVIKQRQHLTASLNEDLIKRYDAMRRSKQGRAISKVEQNSCQWCRVILTPSELQHVRISNELQTCTNCGRILYYDR